MICIICGHVISDSSKRCSYCGAKIENEEEESMYQSFGDLDRDTGMFADGAPGDDAGASGDKDAARTREHDNIWARDFLLSGEENKPYLSMFREKTGETIIIDRFPAVVGRSTKCDYIISGNPTIGRRHILLERREEAPSVPDPDEFEKAAPVPDPDEFEKTPSVPDPDEFEKAAPVPEPEEHEGASSLSDSEDRGEDAFVTAPEKSGDKLYVSDLGSLNHTFIDGVRIQEPVEMYDGIRVLMADEYFVFTILQ